MVPPETLAPVLKQLVDQFISDRTRPEVMAIGLKTVRELAARSPLIMTSDLLRVSPQPMVIGICGPFIVGILIESKVGL